MGGESLEKQEQLRRLTSSYLPAFLGFAINKLGNLGEAEELAQEIACQCVAAIEKNRCTGDFNAYVWSIAHNTFKRWCARKRQRPASEAPNCFTNLMRDEPPLDQALIDAENAHAIRTGMSRLANDYRKTIVCFYCDELSIRQIAQKLSLSDGMVKFYLRAGRQKLKEAYEMNPIGEKSYNPAEFSVYKSSIDFSNVNVWEVFNRKAPCQMALVCHDAAKSIGDIAIETGIPAAYVEEELELLIDAGVMLRLARDQFRTKLFILKKHAAAQIKEQFTRLHAAYAPLVAGAFERHLPALKRCDVFTFDAAMPQWAWFFASRIDAFGDAPYALSDDDYPQILSCGSKGFIFAEEAGVSPWACGVTPVTLDEATVCPCDVGIFGAFHRQNELAHNRPKARALYDVYRGRINPSAMDTYAELMAQGYVIKRGDVMHCNIAVATAKSRALFDAIRAELRPALNRQSREIGRNIEAIVNATIPGQLKAYAKGYTQTWIDFYAGVSLNEALYQQGFLTLPEEGDLTPLACWIDER